MKRIFPCYRIFLVLFAFVSMSLNGVMAESENQNKSESLAPLNTPFEMPQLQHPTFPNHSVSIVKFGAINDGKTLNTNSIQLAINACAQAGGGRVIVPSGKWLTTPLELKSNVELHLEENSEVIFTDEKKYYFVESVDSQVKPGRQNYAPELRDAAHPKSPISATDCQNIAITGPGKLDGQGLGWWPLLPQFWQNTQKQYPKSVYDHAWEGLDPQKKYERPQMLQSYRCRNLLLEGFTIVNSPFWTINPIACENVIVRNLRVRASGAKPNTWSPNTDGINPESCKNVLIENCDVDTGDDSIAIKSGLDEAGRQRGLPCENIVIRNCRVRRIAIGSEMSGGVRNVFIRDCEMSDEPISAWIHIKTRRGRGGVVENIWVENLSGGPCSSAVINLDMEYWTNYVPAPFEPVSERTPQFRNFHFKNITSNHPTQKARAIFINGLPEMPMESITFENIQISSQEGMLCNNARNIVWKNVVLKQ